MFADPFVMTRDYTTLTANAAMNLSLPASERAADHSTYRAIDASNNDHELFIGHQYGRRTRVTARYKVSGYTPSLNIPDQNVAAYQSVYVVADVPSGGPITTWGSETLVFRKQMNFIGSLLVSITGVEPVFYRSVLGET